ncbi:MacB-like periplasmic core domain-containing protein [Desulfonema limicola]|uniref:MacB-like periplasmic core domain-containing protein n=1 Tax=Desulfonema limicola TaxID=45656 RepID=A0A975GIC4_9BACT|nr:ABC transporter permease [Desulfonema limicola]QTA82286.1 MacB-like periplasmic core domain-containing protein [Desulfonema limicola]
MIWNAFVLAIRAIRRNALRSFLTILGIVIGVAAVIIMVTVGQGATAKVTSDISKLGSNLLIITPGQRRGPGGSSSDSKPFEISDVRAIASQIGNLAAAAPVSNLGVTVVYGNINRKTSLTGTENEYIKVRDWSVAEGREFRDSELRSGKAVCIIGATVQKELFGSQNPLGQSIRVKRFSCEVVGVLSAKGQTGMGHDQDDTVIIPLRTFQRRISGNTDVGQIQVSVQDGTPTTKASQDISSLMRERRRVRSADADNFTVRDMTEIADTLSGTTKVLTTLLGSVAAVSLLVGGIGIMNIMLVSVTERTREIGTRLAIGAMEKDVLTQFLVEAVVLSSFGGIIGIVLALSASAGIVKLLGVPLVLDFRIVALAFVFSAAVGVIFGYFPARKAARLDPIEALRYE